MRLLIILFFVGTTLNVFSQKNDRCFRIDLNTYLNEDTVSLIINKVEIFTNKVITYKYHTDSSYIPPMFYFIKSQNSNLFTGENRMTFLVKHNILNIKLIINDNIYIFNTNLKKGQFIRLENEVWKQQKTMVPYF